MNHNPDNSSEMTGNIMRALRSQQRMGRLLIALALSLGIVAIAASIAIVWANLVLIAPMQRLLLQDYPGAERRPFNKIEATSSPATNGPPSQSIPQPGQRNAGGKSSLSKEQLDWRHIQVTAAYGKVIFLTDASIALLAGGTLVTLLLVIFNRRATLRQINVSLAQISDQINELQRRQGPNP